MQKAFLVEDSPLFRGCLSEVLRTLFPEMRVVEFADGRQVVDRVRELQPDIVFMDIKLPGANGLDLTRQIKAMQGDIPIVIMTSHPQPEYADAALDAGADHFFRKDELDEFTLAALISAISSGTHS